MHAPLTFHSCTYYLCAFAHSQFFLCVFSQERHKIMNEVTTTTTSPKRTTRAVKRNFTDESRTTASTSLPRQKTFSSPSIEPKAENEKTDDTPQTVWKNLTSWIVSHGGCVHPNLDFQIDNRKLHYSPISQTDNEEVMNAGTVLANIPNCCLLTIDTAMQSTVGTQINNAIANAVLANHNNDYDNKKKMDLI